MDLSIERARFLLERHGGRLRFGLGGLCATLADGSSVDVIPSRFSLEFDWVVRSGETTTSGTADSADEAVRAALAALGKTASLSDATDRRATGG